ncbi:hypothetical protein GCM10010400_03490 [Streptomyces aculeolatus]|uniref:hypothetical protein n=1 Tax=Streptomyces aculeolatus TaxID=270689 RepID=UPI001CEDA284|nr:hypothetical protein [Streptomyces aculeolatus]
MDRTLSFTAEIRATWRYHTDSTTVPSSHTASLLARQEIEKAAQHCDVLRPTAAEQDIATAVRKCLPLTQDGVVVLDVQVRITVDDSTREAALLAERLRQEYQRKRERLRRDHELDDLAQRQARAREAFLREEILSDPAAARLYGLLEGASNNWPRLGGPPAGTNLEELVREIRQWQPGQRWVTAAQLLHTFVSGLSEEGRKELLIIFSDAVRAFGDEHTAHRLARLSSEER